MGDDRFLLWFSTDWLRNHQGGGKGVAGPGFSTEGSVPRESARTRCKNSGYTASLERAGKERDREQITSERVCAAPGLLQELPCHDVSRAWGCCDPFLGLKLFRNQLLWEHLPLTTSIKERTGCSHCQAQVPGEVYNLRCAEKVRASFLGWVWQGNECLSYQGEPGHSHALWMYGFSHSPVACLLHYLPPQPDLWIAHGQKTPGHAFSQIPPCILGKTGRHHWLQSWICKLSKSLRSLMSWPPQAKIF